MLLFAPWAVLPKVSDSLAVKSNGQFCYFMTFLEHSTLLTSLSFSKVSLPPFCAAAFLGFTPTSQGAASWSPVWLLHLCSYWRCSSGLCPALFISRYSLAHPFYPFPLLPLIVVTVTSSQDHFTEVQIHLYNSLLFISILISHRCPKSILSSCPQIFSSSSPHLSEWPPVHSDDQARI